MAQRGIISFDDKKLKQFARDLKRYAREALPFANRQSINDMAFQARDEANKQLDARLILRNKWTQKSVAVLQARQKKIRDQFAIVGARDQYLEDTEFGTTRRSKGKHGYPMPTRFASGEARGGAPRQRAIRPNISRRKLDLRRGPSGINRKRRNMALVRAAAGSGRKDVALRTNKGLALYRVMGSAKRPRLEMTWQLNRKTMKPKATPWLKPTMAIILERGPAIYRKNLRLQLQRRGLFAR